nr:hypothetical protein GCM10020092_089580 [Actinoplanes digitatis]
MTTSQEEDLHAALNDVRDDLRRRLNDAKTRQEPRNNRHLREQAVLGGDRGAARGRRLPARDVSARDAPDCSPWPER